MSKIYIQTDGKWKLANPTPNLIFVIGPGAGCYANRHAYHYLEQNYKVEYFCKTSKDSKSKFDVYPPDWHDNNFVSNEGEHLGGISTLIYQCIQKNYIPQAIICGSRGGQVTIGKIWESFWRGPTLMINAGCLTTNTRIPKQVSLLFIIMKNDYFSSVNSISKIKILFNNLKMKPDQKARVFYLLKHSHMPNLNIEFQSLLNNGIDLILGKRIIENTKNSSIIVDTI